MRQILNWAKHCFGEKIFISIFGLIIGMLGLAFLIYILRKGKHATNITLSIVILILAIVLMYQIKIPEERIHILEYGILGWLTAKDLIKTKCDIKRVINASIFTISVGCLDELFQKILPYRVFDVRDIIFNSIGSIWGICLYILS